jgi:hypothetical protein
VLGANLVEREAFKTMFSTGYALHDLTDSQVSGLSKAKQDSYALAEAVVDRINENRKKLMQAA